jgi:hypothetical protein
MIIIFNTFTLILGLDTTKWTAITGSQHRSDSMINQFKDKMREQDEVVFGNWVDPNLLKVTPHFPFFFALFPFPSVFVNYYLIF